MAVSVLEWVSASDHRLMRRVNGWKAPRWMRLWMVAATLGGDGWLWCAIAAALLLDGGENRFRAVAAAALAVSAGIALFVNLKKACGRKRPCALEPHCWATLLPPDQFSFPSGHTISAFAVTVAIAHFYPSLRGGLMFAASSVAISRVILGMHFLSDVLAGAAIGSLLGWSAALLLG